MFVAEKIIGKNNFLDVAYFICNENTALILI